MEERGGRRGEDREERVGRIGRSSSVQDMVSQGIIETEIKMIREK